MSAVASIELGARLKGERWPVHRKTTIELEGEVVAVEILQPPSYPVTRALEAARAAGDLDQNYRPIGELGRQRLLVRMVCLCMFAPNGDALFDQNDLDAVASRSWLSRVQLDCLSAVVASGGNLANLYAGVGRGLALTILLAGVGRLLTGHR
jgi:hypothetical protein